MAVQFAGSGSTGSRRRRRMVVNGDGTAIDSRFLEGDGAEMESQLVASAAAGPWVPETELRIWIYSTILFLYLGAVGFLLVNPINVPNELALLADSLLSGPRPTLLICTEVALLFLSTQLGFLIAWYRARCRLDFGGRYRVWPWAICFFGLATVCRATELHRVAGAMIETSQVLQWRGSVVGWLLPFCLAALPLAVLLDRDVRNGRSSLWTLRASGVMWLATAYLEVFQPELLLQPWYSPALVLLPLIASGSLFVGLWHHARVVAYVCPDPPELDERSAMTVLLGVVGMAAGLLVFWKRGEVISEEDDESKPKRRRKKAEADEATAKKKRKAPARKPATRSKTRTKPVEDSEESSESEASEDTGESWSDESSESSANYEEPAEETSVENGSGSENGDSQEQWQDEEDPYTSSDRNRSSNKSKGRDSRVHQSHGSSTPAPHITSSARSWEEETTGEEQSSANSFDSAQASDEDGDDQNDGLTAEQMKGLSKRQKRELKKQLRDQERTRQR